MKKLINLIGKTLIIFILYLFADIALMKLLPNDIKGKIYDKRTHKIKSYYYHHDLRPNAHWIESWGDKNSKIFVYHRINEYPKYECNCKRKFLFRRS